MCSLNKMCLFSSKTFNTVLISLKYLNRPFSTAAKMTNKPGNSNDIVWMDLEMTGLDAVNDKILEISCLITDRELNIKSEGPSLVLHCPKNVLDNMNEWCVQHHNESGLCAKVLQSDITARKAEDILLAYLEANVPQGKCPLAGNSVYMDRMFLSLHMPRVHNYLHYRIIDVSTVKELARRWNHTVLTEAPAKKFAHRTLDDIKDSIEELKYYKRKFF